MKHVNEFEPRPPAPAFAADRSWHLVGLLCWGASAGLAVVLAVQIVRVLL